MDCHEQQARRSYALSLIVKRRMGSCMTSTEMTNFLKLTPPMMALSPQRLSIDFGKQGSLQYVCLVNTWSYRLTRDGSPWIKGSTSSAQTPHTEAPESSTMSESEPSGALTQEEFEFESGRHFYLSPPVRMTEKVQIQVPAGMTIPKTSSRFKKWIRS